MCINNSNSLGADEGAVVDGDEADGIRALRDEVAHTSGHVMCTCMYIYIYI